MPVGAALMTVAEFRQLPEPQAYILELRHGEVVQVTRPKKRHDDRVYRLERDLQPMADRLGYLIKAFAFRALPEYELRVADLAFVPWERWDAVGDDDNLAGAPDFVVEVASPSNSAEELQEKRQLCLATGCREFWVVYPKLEQIEVSNEAGTRTCRRGETIRLQVLPGELAVGRVFDPLR